jgi:hypothetical protein
LSPPQKAGNPATVSLYEHIMGAVMAITKRRNTSSRAQRFAIIGLPPESGHVRCEAQCLLWANSGRYGMSIKNIY